MPGWHTTPHHTTPSAKRVQAELPARPPAYSPASAPHSPTPHPNPRTSPAAPPLHQISMHKDNVHHGGAEHRDVHNV